MICRKYQDVYRFSKTRRKLQNPQEIAKAAGNRKKIVKSYREKYSEETMKKENITASNLTAHELYYEHMESEPEVLRLKLSLDLEYVDEEDMDILRKYGNVKEGIIREILVPADITLHALSYAIIRSFGWQNSHLHSFVLPDHIFYKITKEKEPHGEFDAYDALYTEWLDLCGLYFRYPFEYFEDVYWDDDYEEGESFKRWISKKYTGPYRYGGHSENYFVANALAVDTINVNPMIKVMPTFTEFLEMKHEGRENEIDNNKFKPIEEATVYDMQPFLDGALDELLERIPLIEILAPQDIKEDEHLIDKVKFLKHLQKRTLGNLPVTPVTDKLIYKYDSGDGWKVNIVMTDCYYMMDEDNDEISNKNVINIVNYYDRRKKPENFDVFDMNNQLVEEELALKISAVRTRYRPKCISSDGLPVMDDVGGVGGYINFLRTIHGDDPEEKAKMKDWAKWMGWTGRTKKPDSIL